VNRTTVTLKALHCRSSTGSHGPERAILELAPALSALGVDTELVALYRRPSGGPPEHPWLTEAERYGWPVHQIADPSALSVRAVRRLAWRVRRAGADLLHTHDYKSNLLGGLVARQADRSMPWVATVHLHTTTTRRLKVYRALDLFLLRLADRVVTVSRDQRRLLLSRGVDRRRVVLIPNVIDAEAYAGRAAEPAETRAQLGVPEDTPLVLVVGRLTPQKGVDILLAALPAVLSSAPSALVLLAGSGVAAPALQAATAAAGLGDHVRFLGSRDDVPSLLAASDLGVVPSRSEGLPLALLEAMALGRAVVATHVGGIADLLVDGQHGWLVPAGNPEALGTAISGALANPEARRQIGAAGRQRVGAVASPARAARRLAAVYRTVLAERA
jgi:glycosyltransferase involved in cell wall biosynthesis